MKEIYFLRHGEANWPDWGKADDERPLTEKGTAEMRRVASFLHGMAEPELIVTSPLPRAAQTAEIVAERLEVELAVDKLLEPGFHFHDLAKLSRKYKVESMMIVGHEPDLSSAIRNITGGNVKMSKAGMALVRMNGSLRSGVLRWLLPPKLSKSY